jgi:tetratricopeptide (TPR) repeat protein
VELPENSSVLVLLATIEQADGRWASVLDLLGPAAERNPLHDQINYLVVRSYERLGRIEEALAALARRREALAGVGRSGEAALVEASAVLLASRNDRAEAALEMAKRALQNGTALDSETALDLRLLQADLEFELHGFAPAIAGLGEGDRGVAAAEIGAKRYELAIRGDDAKAAAGYRRALAEGGLDDLLALAAAEERLEKYQAALPLIEKGLAAEPESPVLRFRKATALERTGRFDESAAIFEELIASDPDHAPALNYLGYMRIERGTEVEKGLALVRRALQIDANNGAYVDSLGWGLYRLGRFAEASEVLERASRLLPGDSTVLEHLGDSLLALGALDRARDAYRRALAAGPEGSSGLAAKLANLPGAS